MNPAQQVFRPCRIAMAWALVIVAALSGCAQQARLPAPADAAGGSGPPGRVESSGPAPQADAQAPATTWMQYRQRAAHKIAQSNLDRIYLDAPPDILLAIPVLEIELHADGSIRRIEVLRHPKQAQDTTQLAIDAVRRAAPFGDVSRLPRPWRFPETFLFRDDRRFKPRTLD